MSENKIKFSENPAGNPVIEFGYFLSEEEEEAFSNYINSIRKTQREHIIKILESIRVGDEMIGRDYAIELIKGDNK